MFALHFTRDGMIVICKITGMRICNVFYLSNVGHFLSTTLQLRNMIDDKVCSNVCWYIFQFILFILKWVYLLSISSLPTYIAGINTIEELMVGLAR